MTRGEALAAAVERLRMAKIDTPELDARVLLKHAFRLTDAELIAAADSPASPEGALMLETLVARRARGEPVARLLGHREFWGMRFDLGPDTLVPRPESETLIEAALASFGGDGPARVLDLGTGSGCLLIAALSEWPDAKGLGLDLAPRAVEVAAANAARLGFAERAQFLVSDWDAAAEGLFDLILSNPPYIETAAIESLAPEVRLHDPALALDGGPDGLDGYRALARAAERRLASRGVLICELGESQEAAAAAIFEGAGLRAERPGMPDLAGISRALIVRR